MDSKTSLKSGLTLAALGVVYGDIGTSPLYALKEVFAPHHGIPVTVDNILGAASLIIWSLIIIVSLKYVTLILRADNQGEGGIMALLALALSGVGPRSRQYFVLMLIGLAGTSLFYGDGVITPAITILSAVEGMEIATPLFKPYVVAIAALVVVLLYAFQHRGTAGLGRFFGPFMVLWFGTLAVMGVINIVETPSVLAAFHPAYAFNFFAANKWFGFIALGAIFLALTGAEALYADMGHFGKQPIRRAWFYIVFPALVLNYLGQSATLMNNPAAAVNPFYYQLGSWSILPLVVLATLAAVIAAQATIAATFSVTQAAISLGFLPRMKVIHTSEHEKGQIYIPLANWLQMAIVLCAVVGFGSSTSLVAAYGIAVSTTMLATTVLTYFVIRYMWGYNPLLCWLATAFFVLIDLVFLAANGLKIADGGWFPLVLGAATMLLMLIWRTGRDMVADHQRQHLIALPEFMESLFASPPLRVPGTAVFFRAEGDGVPHALLHNLLHNKVLHEKTIFLTVHNRDIPAVPEDERISVTPLGHNCFQLDIRYGFKDERNVIAAMNMAQHEGIALNIMDTSFFIARQTMIPVAGGRMPKLGDAVFAIMSKNARDAAEYYQLPANRVIELGTQVEI